MQPASYTIDLLPPGDLVNIRLAGFMSLADTAAYVAEAEAVILACHGRNGHYRMLLDVSGCAIQSQEVLAAFVAHVQRMPVSVRSAVVVGGSMIKMQVRRVLERPNVMVFEDRAEALAWAGDESLAEAPSLALSR